MIRIFMLMGLLTLVAGVAPARPVEPSTPATKDLIVDGSVVHDMGNLHLNITNFGLIGSQYSAGMSWSQAPSAEWPAGSGTNHLWAAGLWVGAVKNGEPLVSTGQYQSEIMAAEGPAEVIYPLAWDLPGAMRYPFENSDDDGDGQEDEDPFNGRDDDQDGQVDEDDGGAGDQMFRAEMYDNTPLAQEYYPDHQPLDLSIVQRSLQWAAPEVDDMVGFEFAITNIGEALLEQVHVGLFSDFDIDDSHGGAIEAADDLVGFETATVEAYPGQWVDVSIGHAHEGVGATDSGWIGWALLGHPIDPAGEVAPVSVSVRSFQRYSGQAPYQQGGDPVNDDQRYETMADGGIDSDAVAPDDYRHLVSCGPFASPGAGRDPDRGLCPGDRCRSPGHAPAGGAGPPGLRGAVLRSRW